jgi:phosphoribosylformylglycinamidine cyclo-ligase
VGDVVRTIAVNGTMTARWPISRLVTNDKIRPGDVIIGLAGFGETVYEQSYNSGIGSNGLTSARHDMLHKHYANEYPESCDPGLDDSVTYIGPYRLQDTPDGLPDGINVGKLLLSPTRTFAPVMKEILERHFDDVHGLIHCSGGGQTKCLKYLPGPMRIVKDDFFDIPPVFRMIQQASGSDDREMFQVFNMGCRMEIYTNPGSAAHMLTIARHWGVEAKIIGRVEESAKKELVIAVNGGRLVY